MSVIRKLLIQGVRSFDPQNQDIIEFYAPLTIIVGQNGCGKTTIIESLKYITTGELPPNSKGGAFIHDPKLVGESEVKAQVKLRFYNVSQRSMTCVRSMLLSQKKAAVTQKTLEGALSFDATATEEKVSISSRCADLDAMMPEQLGVSKAVLENVIFCHQEESNWPLSEASVLKKKFDEIFAATRYTKALESIKAIRKNQAIEIRVQRGELKHLEEKKAKAERVHLDLEKANGSIHSYRMRIDQALAQEKHVTAQIESLTGQLQEFMSLRTAIEGLQMSLDQKIASYKELEANTVLLDISDQELEHEYADVCQKVESRDADAQNKRLERDLLQKKLSEAQAEMYTILSEIGQLQAARSNLEEKLANRLAVVAELCGKYGIITDATADSEQQAAECTIKIMNLVKEADQERMIIRQQSELEEKKLQSDIDSVQQEIYSFNNAAEVCGRQLSANTLEIERVQLKHDSLLVEELELKSIEAELQEEKQHLAGIEEQNLESTYNEKAKQKRLELVGIADEIARLNSEISHNNMQADTRARLSLRRKELEEKELRLKEIAADSELAAWIPGEKPFADEGKRTKAISEAIQAKKHAIADCTQRTKEAMNDLSSTQMRLKLARQSHEQQLANMAQKRVLVSKACGTQDFETAYSEAQADLHELMEMAGHYKSASSMYKAYIQKIENDHSCPVCQRGWSNKADEERLVSKLRLDYTSAPTELLRIENDIRKGEERLEELAGLQSAVCQVKDWDERERIELESQIGELTEKVEIQSTAADDVDAEAVLLASELDDLVALLAKSKELCGLENVRKELVRQIEVLEHELQATGSVKTAEELQKEIATLQAQDAVARRELDRIGQDHILKQKEIGFRQENMRKLQSKLDEYSRQAQERKALLEQVTELKSRCAENQAGIEVARESANELAPRLKEKQTRLADFRSEAKSKEDIVDERVRELAQSKDRLALMSCEINQMRESLSCPSGEDRYSDRLAMVNAQKDSLQKETSEWNVKYNEAVSALQEANRITANLVTKQRELSDNMRLRAFIADQKHLEAELKITFNKQSVLESQLSEVPDDNADDDDDMIMVDGGSHKRRYGDGNSSCNGHGPNKRRGGTRLQHRRDALNTKLSKLTSERAGLQGEVKQLEDQASRLSHELSTDYKDVDMLYVRQLVQCKTEELANTDLETYSKALDAAIMRYHSLKMQDINKIIRELWINTYQGNDIDTIEIRSEVEGARNSRSHNYRVVMIKGGHAIDMRGRCSAGQKVLACLIIRLALAETFSVNCGILALDEPTTNLDQENIDSLAHSLARIIKSRQEQRNFQLIVITHDEIFMQLLGKSEYADYYWRVYKDENQRSVFARRPISNN
ncbi:DNA repair protein rad50 [Coemansia spiralis]|uniref:DNA repair protein RAD50 n=2 Tax=Coemansia TaxID=4863 RepID=A0A9W8KZ95_9FUNG|nr:DNA repair protein rad50 [Coemansia umbellata]KAJ2622872.1 DNA repair protein rad50 [Coemansia sp. RSA 1358]KAJ2678213.1 DNA repair protein rad50 [Coemansia spiralis]